ncbi:YcnI family protein [Streptomyces sp. PTM05]|uniref:YcnI family protein n=1 Tax=Streptantibioticus parmotrematis TaxID=2873249 RepID=A0ABS7QUC8_9ACTN|nr:YcnI family protein [Streptantibioticus parmotrematis]MBY8886795.1 YcnI family protein [Streptantibioticus parmotrematis]
MSIPRTRAFKRLSAVAAATGATVLLVAAPAFAHVTVSPTTAPKGSYSTVAFKVPNEEDNADTTKLQVFFPADEPLASVEVQPVPGWTATVTKTKLAKPITTDDGQVTEAVSSITWSGGAIKPGEFQQFPVALGPLPTNTGKLTFKALQTYGTDQVVRWIDIPQAGQAEPAHPAPTLTLTAAGSDAAATAPAAQTTAAKQGSGSGGSDDTARTLAVVGIVLGAAGVGYGVFAGRRRGGAGPDSGAGTTA